jgi:hypothetical protein
MSNRAARVVQWDVMPTLDQELERVAREGFPLPPPPPPRKKRRRRKR